MSLRNHSKRSKSAASLIAMAILAVTAVLALIVLALPAAAQDQAPCEVTFGIQNRWWNGFTYDQMTITNNLGVALDGWTVTWTWPDGYDHAIDEPGWNADFGQTGKDVSGTNMDYNKDIADGETKAINAGFTGTLSGELSPLPPLPVISLNGTPCAGTVAVGLADLSAAAASTAENAALFAAVALLLAVTAIVLIRMNAA